MMKFMTVCLLVCITLGAGAVQTPWVIRINGITKPHSSELADDYQVLFVKAEYEHYYSGTRTTYTTYSDVSERILTKSMNGISVSGYKTSIQGVASWWMNVTYLNYYKVIVVVLDAPSIAQARHYALLTCYVRASSQGDEEVVNFKDSYWYSINRGKSTSRTPVPVPYEWIDDQCDVTRDLMGDYELAAESVGANGYKLYNSYVAGLEPTDPKSKFSTKIEFKDGKPVVSWEPALNGTDEAGRCKKTGVRTYRVLGSTDLKAWREVNDGEESKYSFFRVNVEMP